MLALFQQRFPSTGLLGLSDGVDLSGWQSPSIWPSLDWVKWSCAKVTEGTNYTERLAVGHSQAAIARTVPWGLYHYAKWANPDVEAQFYLAGAEMVHAAVGAKPTFHMLDLEDPVGGDVTAWAERWCQVVESAMPAPVVIYTGPSWANAHLRAGGTGLENRPLWIAHYASAGTTAPWVPALWSDWTIWQWTSTPDGMGHLDVNVARPSFLDLIGAPHGVLPPTLLLEDDVARLILTPDGTVWSTDGVTATPLRQSYGLVRRLGLTPPQPEWGEPCTWDEAADLLTYDDRTDSLRPIRVQRDPNAVVRPGASGGPGASPDAIALAVRNLIAQRPLG